MADNYNQTTVVNSTQVSNTVVNNNQVTLFNQMELKKSADEAESIVSQLEKKVTNKALDMGVNAAMSLSSTFGGALVEAGAKAVQFGSEFESSMAKVSTRIGASQADMDSLQQEVLALSDKSGVAASELGDAMYTALSAGVQMGDGGAGMMQYLENCTELARASFSDLDTAVSATAGILRDYHLDLSDTEQVQKVLMQTQLLGGASLEELGNAMALVSPAAAATGVGVEQVGAALSVMTAQGVPAAAAAGQLGQLLTALSTEGSQAQQALSDAAAGTQYAGMSFQEMMAAGLPLNEVLDMMGVNADMSEEAMLDMFGSLEAGEAALSLSGENAQLFSDDLSAMSTEMDVVGETADIMADTTGEKLGGVMNELQNALIQIFLAGEPFINTLLPVISDLLGLLLPPLTSIIEKMMPVIQAQLEALMPIVEAALKILLPILDAVIGMIAPVLELVFTALTPLLEIVGTLLEYAFKPFQAAIGYLSEAIGSRLGGAVQFIKDAFDRVKNIFSNIIDFIKNVFTGNWQGVWDNIVNIFSNIVGGIKAVFLTPINWIIDGLNAFIRTVNKIKIPDWVPGIGGKGFHIPEIARLKVGMDYVPSDDFPALLHKGEAVLPAPEAEVYRGLGGVEGLERSLSYMAASAEVNPVIVVQAGDTYLDGEKISQHVTTLQYTDAAVRRYRG